MPALGQGGKRARGFLMRSLVVWRTVAMRFLEMINGFIKNSNSTVFLIVSSVSTEMLNVVSKSCCDFA